MGVLSDRQIRTHVKIEPYDNGAKKPGVISYGSTSYGYDIRVGNHWKVFKRLQTEIIDPKNFDPTILEDLFADTCIIPANSFVLAESVETFEIPRDVLGICLGKSTLARCGLIVNITPLEPEWKGKLTIEISNTTPVPVKLYANEGIAQLIFIRADCPELGCEVSYADKNGKYQTQLGLTLPKV